VIGRFKRMCNAKKLLTLAGDVLDRNWLLWQKAADPDMACFYLEQWMESTPDPESMWSSLQKSEGGFSRLVEIFGQSRYLSEILLKNPEHWDWVREPKHLSLKLTEENLLQKKWSSASVESVRYLRQQETFRIALVESFGIAPLRSAHHMFSLLAEVILQNVFRVVFGKKDLCVIGLGKLGGDELNYSSDVDLIFVAGRDGDHEAVTRQIQTFSQILMEGGAEDFLYRVDLRIRPHGDDGSLYLSRKDYEHYYVKDADQWEYQALLKARPVAGKKALGKALLKTLNPVIYRKKWAAGEIHRLQEIKRFYEEDTRSKGEEDVNIKMGYGGIRDIEFTAQIIQLIHGDRNPSLKTVNTLDALHQIERLKLLNEKDCRTLTAGYELTRRIENRLQLFENRREFNVPPEPSRLRWLAKCLQFKDEGHETAELRFQRTLQKGRKACRAIFERVFFG